MRSSLVALEEKDGFVVATKIYERLCLWLQEVKKKSREDLKEDQEIMSYGTFAAWLCRNGKLGKSRKWRDNISAYIEKGCTEPMGKRSKASPYK